MRYSYTVKFVGQTNAMQCKHSYSTYSEANRALNDFTSYIAIVFGPGKLSAAYVTEI